MPPSTRSPVFARVFLALVCLLFVFVCAAVRFPALYRFWSIPLHGEAFPYFKDTFGLLGGAEDLRANGGRFSWDFITAHGYTFNYPHVWAYLGLLGLRQAHCIPVGLFLAAALLFYQYRLLRPVDGRSLIFSTLILFSPSCMLLMERGNSDIVVFALVMAATALLASETLTRRSAGGGLILAAACLKLFPVAALAAVPSRGGWRTVGMVGACLGVFGLYAFVQRDDFVHIAKITPRPYHGAYGGLALTSFVDGSLELRAAMAKLGVDLSAPERRETVVRVVRFVSLGALLGLGAGALLMGVRSAGWGPDAMSTELDRIRFRAGAAMYGTTFLIGNNWDYRMACLAFTVPLLSGWLRTDDPALRRRAGLVLGLMLLGLWAFVAPRAAWAFVVIQGVTWCLFAVLMFLFGLLLPVGFRDPLRRVMGGRSAP